VQNRINRIQLQQQSQFELSDWLDDIWCCHGLYLFPSPGERAPNNSSKCTQDECVYRLSLNVFQTGSRIGYLMSLILYICMNRSGVSQQELLIWAASLYSFCGSCNRLCFKTELTMPAENSDQETMLSYQVVQLFNKNVLGEGWWAFFHRDPLCHFVMGSVIAQDRNSR